MNGIYTMASSSVSSLYGNIGCAIRELILSKFPYEYFKYTNVSSEVAFRNMRRQFGSNTNTEISKRKRPYLIIQPQYQEPDPDGFLQNIPLTKNEMDVQYGVDSRYLFWVLKDPDNMYNLKFKLNRDRIEYEVTVSVNTQMQQLDIYKAMINQMTWDRWTYYPAALESVIPKTMMKYISKLCGLDIDRTPELVPQFIRHVNSVASYPITYKLRNASATDEYFMYYTHNLMVLFQDLNLGTGNQKGMLNESFDITFKVTVEFNLPGLYILEGDVQKLNELKVLLVTDTPEEAITEYIPLYSVTNLFNKYPKMIDGMALFASYIFNTDAGKGTEDILDLKDHFDSEHRMAIALQVKNNVPPETFSKLIILKDGKELAPDKWKMDWMTMRLYIYEPDDRASYRLMIYLNMESINDIIANTRIDGPYDQHDMRENHIDYSKVEGVINTSSDVDPGDNTETDFKATVNEDLKDIPQKHMYKSSADAPIEHEVIVAIEGTDDYHEPELTVPAPGENLDIEVDPNQTYTIEPTDEPKPEEPTLEEPSEEPDEPIIDEPQIEEPKEPEEDPDMVIKKYHSSIFDDPSKVDAIEPPKRSRFSSSANPNRRVSKIIFRDNPNPGILNSLDVWTKIISTTTLYNFATKIAVEHDNNYKIEAEIRPTND